MNSCLTEWSHLTVAIAGRAAGCSVGLLQLLELPLVRGAGGGGDGARVDAQSDQLSPQVGVAEHG